GSAAQALRDADRAGAAAAREGLATAALPRPLPHRVRARLLDELHVRAPREERVALDRRADFRDREALDVVDGDDAVRAAHRDARPGELGVAAAKRAVDEAIALEERRDLGGREDRLAHADADARDGAVRREDPDLADARRGLHAREIAADVAAIVEQLADAAK